MLIKLLAFTRWQHVDLIIELIDSFLRARYNTRHVSSGLYYLSPSFSSNTICQTLRPSLCIMEGKQAWLVRKFVYSFFTYLKHTSSFSKHISKLLHNQETLLKNTLKKPIHLYLYGIHTFGELRRKHITNFIHRLQSSSNSIIMSVVLSSVPLSSLIWG